MCPEGVMRRRRRRRVESYTLTTSTPHLLHHSAWLCSHGDSHWADDARVSASGNECELCRWMLDSCSSPDRSPHAASPPPRADDGTSSAAADVLTVPNFTRTSVTSSSIHRVAKLVALRGAE